MVHGKYIFIFIVIVIIIAIIIIIKPYFNKCDFFTVDNYALMNDLYEEPYIINDLITENEAKYIIDTATTKFDDSTVLGHVLDKSIRKSKTAWLYKDSNPIIMRIMLRIANIVKLPLENAEALQIVKYEPDGYYKEHHDSCCDNVDDCTEFVKRGGQRIKTVLIYLNDDFTEGSTYFPVLNKKFKPPKYSAIVFNPLAGNSNKCHPKALHTGLPVKSGIKYIANLWFREGKFV
jgi:prolyl 4-hydroxylase